MAAARQLLPKPLRACQDPGNDLIQELYESRGRTYVTVIPSPDPGKLMDGQITCYQKCFEMAKDVTDWFIVIVRALQTPARGPLLALRHNVTGIAVPVWFLCLPCITNSRQRALRRCMATRLCRESLRVSQMMLLTLQALPC